MTDPTWVSVLPPAVAIVLAIATRQVVLSLATGVWLGWTILAGWNPLVGLARSVDGGVSVLADRDSASVILFTLAIGALIATIERSGGVRGFVNRLEDRRWVSTPRRVRLLPWVIGIVIFIESNLTILVGGAVARPLFDSFRVSREKLAYLIDSTSAPICILIPLNAWGAYNLGILEGLGAPNPIEIFVGAIPLNFYAIAAVLLAGATAAFDLDFGPMRRAEERAREGRLHGPEARPMIEEDTLAGGTSLSPRALNMIAPLAVLVAMVPLGLRITGGGEMSAGEGSTAVLWAVLAALAAAWILVLVQRGDSLDELMRTAFKGAGALLPLGAILLLALTLGGVAGELGTGPYLAGLTSRMLPPPAFLPVVFLISAGISFATGTSWGTFAIMLPIVVPAGLALQLPLSPFVAAALSGGIFGDHASPISDTTIISSMAAGTDHIDHVRTQLPYALTAAAAAGVAFAVLGSSL